MTQSKTNKNSDCSLDYLPTISVVIPCYNRASMVSKTIQNMIDQSLPPKEIIVVDDGSTDNSADVISSFGGIVRLIKQTNQGPGAARNAGLKASSGEFIQFMDSDDLASRNKLKVQVDALRNTDADFAYCPWIRSKIQNTIVTFKGKILQGGPVPSSKPMLEWFVSGWSLVFQNCLFRRTILNKAGFYRSDLMPSEDSEYFVRILMAGAQPVYTPECLVYYREHDEQKITSSGTTQEHRGKDWTHYLQITGEQLSGQLTGMKWSTKIALSAAVRDHLRYCAAHGLLVLPSDHPYLQLLRAPLNSFLSKTHSMSCKIRRRISGSPDYHPAFKCKPVDDYYKELTLNTGFTIKQA